MMKKGRAQNLMMLAAVAVLVYLLFTMNNKSAYSIREREFAMIQGAPAAAGEGTGAVRCRDPRSAPRGCRAANRTARLIRCKADRVCFL